LIGYLVAYLIALSNAGYAPHTQAVLGQFGRDDLRYIPFTLLSHAGSIQVRAPKQLTHEIA
jgi:hypothetical protein